MRTCILPCVCALVLEGGQQCAMTSATKREQRLHIQQLQLPETWRPIQT